MIFLLKYDLAEQRTLHWNEWLGFSERWRAGSEVWQMLECSVRMFMVFSA